MKESEPRKLYREIPEKVAYLEGWNVAKANEPASAQRVYLTHEERQAFKDGWYTWWAFNAPGHRVADAVPYVPLSPTGAELLFEVFSQRYEHASTIITSNLPFEEWTSVFGSERLTGALLDRLTHHVHVLTMNGGNYRLAQSAARRRPHSKAPHDVTTAVEEIDPQTGELLPN